MPEFAELPRLPYVFHGGLAFNQRTLSGAVTTLIGEDDRGRRFDGVPMTLNELSAVLLLLESIAMSTGMYLDGTLPPADIERMETALWRLTAQSGAECRVEFVRPAPDALVTMFREAADTGTLLMADGLSRLPDQRDEPMAGDIAPFVAAVRQLDGDATGERGAQFAKATAAAAAVGEETFRGAKCVAGLGLLPRGPDSIVTRASTLLQAADDQTQRKAVAVLVNRFRINYVNMLAGTRKAAYLADVSIEDLKSAQVILFCRYLAQKLSEAHAGELTSTSRDALDQQLRAVPLGFAILMNSTAAFPGELLHEATAVRKLGLGSAAALESPQDRFLHQLNDDEFGRFRDYLFKSQFIRLMNESERREILTTSWRTMYVPVGIAGVVGAVAGTLLAGPLGPLAGAALGSLTGTLTQVLGDGVVSGSLAGHRVSVDQYRKLNRYLGLAAKHQKLTGVADRVQDLFKRPLAPA